ncbi:hypothetical protein FQN50_007561 [Emmonsiellopsis sp. PD_5]|nr:hypothetical protein FQN50_007561 [Emmonsiellopsis sp. PD_5]
MRFENWDVLLFPDSSKVPVQEFKTQCFVTRDTDCPYLHNNVLLNPTAPHLSSSADYGHGGPGQTPILTAFIPSLARNDRFRVSVHNWEKPVPTRVMESLMGPGDTVLNEIRVFIDGVCVSLVSQRISWPHVIELSSHVDKNGNQDYLRFPAFHEELLQQAHWEAGETFGRIRIIIAEGFSRPNREPPFERVRDLIIFSFQHAPLSKLLCPKSLYYNHNSSYDTDVLEHSNLAWPNPGMWYQASRPSLKYNLGIDHGNVREDEDLHSHSPTRPEHRQIGIADYRSLPYSMWSHRFNPTSQSQWPQATWLDRESRWAPPPVNQNSFVDPLAGPVFGRRARSTLEDVPMPDYAASSSNSSRAISNMTGVSVVHSKQPSITAPMDDEQYNQLIDALSPKKPASGTCAPTNTPCSVPPMASKPSAAAEARAASHSRHSSRGVLKEISQPGIRVVSGSSARSDSGDEAFGSENAALPTRLLSPSPQVKGKKEGGGGSEADSPLRGSTKRSARASILSRGSLSASAESKRRRSSAPAQPELKIFEDKATPAPSPTKKVSRTGEKDENAAARVDEVVEVKEKQTKQAIEHTE